MRIQRIVFAAVFVLTLSSAASAGEALDLLKEGNARFVKMEMQHPDQSAERRTDTAVNGQKPFAVILSCSDSRVPPEIVFDRGIGDIFVVRVAGNIAMDESVIGSVEYAIEHLNVPLLVVMGHTGCGAVNAAISGAPVEGGVRDIQEKIEPVVARVRTEQPDLTGAALSNAVVKSNALQAKDDLLSRSEELREMADKGKVTIAVCVYDINSGEVAWE